MKTCSSCGIEKRLSDFYHQSNKKDGHRYVCKACYDEQLINAHLKNPWKRTLRNAKQRCTSQNVDNYERYGGRGIKCLITEDEIKELWFRDKAYNMKKPSIDRKDNDENYTFDNCRFIEFGENAAKDKLRPILQFTRDNKFIKEWDSAAEIERCLNFAHNNISVCCTGKRQQAYGFNWKFKTTCSITKK
jgi:hypothetical protein